jgi:hypothetical protein
MAWARTFEGPTYFACHFFSSLPSARYSFASRISHPRTSTYAMPRTANTNNPSDVMNTVHTVPHHTICSLSCQKLTFARSIQHDATSTYA